MKTILKIAEEEGLSALVVFAPKKLERFAARIRAEQKTNRRRTRTRNHERCTRKFGCRWIERTHPQRATLTKQRGRHEPIRIFHIDDID